MPDATAARRRTVHHQPSWRFASRDVEANVTELGGHVGPVTFDRQGRKLQPLSVAPWSGEKLAPDTPAILRVLRGDFFCMPFGGNAQPHRSESHPVHGEPANKRWAFESLNQTGGRTELHLSLKTRIRPGRVDKHLSLVDGHPALYSRHVVSGMSGAMPLGHHAMLEFPDEPGSGAISTSRFVLGQVYPEPFEDPAEGGYSILKPGATFRRLDRVPMITGEKADLSRYPARRGFEDLVQLMADPDLDVAWTAVTFPKERYAWFSLKDPRVLSSTVLWHSNGGRHYAPWNGRHVGVLGLEEVTGYFADGLAASVKKNPHTERGLKTAIRLNPRKPLAVNTIMAAVPVPAGFDRVKRIARKNDGVELTAASGKRVTVPLDVDFLYTSA